MALIHTPVCNFGAPAPNFSLPGVDGQIWTLQDCLGPNGLLVMFICNHCPYVKGSEDMLIEIVRRHGKDGLKAIAISSNDASQYPEDSFEKMSEKASAMSLPYPYLYDEDQSVAKAFDAACTPEFYLFGPDGKLAYHGTINDSPRDPSKVTKDFLSEAIVAVLEGRQPSPAFVHPLGCSIKWKRP